MDATAFEVALVVPKKDGGSTPRAGAGDGTGEVRDCVEFLVQQLVTAGLVVERVQGITEDFIKLAAPLDTLGKAAAELEMRKPTHIGMDFLFEWDQVDAFVRQPDGSLFSWYERFVCFNHLVYGIVNKGCTDIKLEYDAKIIWWRTGESLVRMMEAKGIVKQVFPVHDEGKRKLLLRKWGLKFFDITWQPIDEIYGYFGMKIATYFSFLGMYTNWLLFPAVFGLVLDFINFGSWQFLALPIFFVIIITWAALFLQFWKRKNAALLTRWQVSYSIDWEPGHKAVEFDWGPLLQPYMELKRKIASEASKRGDKKFLREDLVRRLMRIRNDVIVISGIIFLQVPFELAYANLYEIVVSDVMRFFLTAVYLLVIQYYTRLCGKVSVKLIKYEHNKSKESNADSLVYKVFGLYFIQSYIGLFYHTILYRNILTLRQILVQRLIISQVVENLLENTIPYLKYSIKKYKAFKKKTKSTTSTRKALQLCPRVEKEYLKPAYCASIGEELEDGLFDDFLELALQFGMIMMFACAFPLAFVFTFVNNVTEIRTDAVKLLIILRRPIPRAAATIGAWMNIFQFLIVMAICTNCVLLVCFYDEEGKWTLEPGLAAILVVEHVLLLMKFVFSRIVPEEPAWVRASRVKNAAQVREVCSKQLLRSLYSLGSKQE